MNKTMLKFVKTHKKEIAIGVSGLVLTGVAGYLFGRSRSGVVITNKHLAELLVEAQKELAPCTLFLGKATTPIEAEDLGALGDIIIKMGGESGTYKYFVAIGEDVKS